MLFPHKMAGDFDSVKQDDREIVAIPGFEFGPAGNVHHLKRDAAALDDLFSPVAQMATGLGVNDDSVHGWKLTTKTQRHQG